MAECPQARRLIKRYVGSEEFINGVERWCLWLHGVRPEDLRKMAPVQKRMEAVMAFREASSAEPTRKAASSPASFFYVSQPTTSYLAIPEGSSSRRRYIPIGILSADTIASNKLFIIPATDLWLFGILSSSMHMSWVSLVGGRIKSDYSYSGSMVYNTFPWPEVDKAKTARLEELAQAVLDARAQFPRATLADLYDPLTMPPALLKAHRQLDRAVERCYRKELFDSDRERVEFLFARYEQLTAPLVAAAAPRRRAR